MGASSNTESNAEEKNSKNGKEVPIEPMNEIDVNQLPYKHVKNKEIYLLKLVSKKLIITDSHLSDGIKPTDEDNMIITKSDTYDSMLEGQDGYILKSKDFKSIESDAVDEKDE